MVILLKPKTLFSACLITGVIALTLSCNRGSSTTEEVTEVRTPVRIVPVIFKSVSSSVDLPAVTMFMNKNIIRAATTGIIEKISIKPGDYVIANQLLFTIRTRESIALASSHISDTSFAFKGIINITSNKEGVISSVAYQKGDFVQEGDEMAVVSDQSSLVFILDVPFELEVYIEKNRRCTIILPDKREITGNITGKLPEMDVQSQTIRYVIKPISAGHLPANLIGTVGLVRSTVGNAQVLPKRAVLGDETQTEFWIMKLINDSTAIKVIVKKGFENNDEVEITDPLLATTDRIILTGNYGLPDTARISIIKE
jgi:multidrug efflux pump subunit AcrA (membrane-fusion protein)